MNKEWTAKISASGELQRQKIGIVKNLYLYRNHMENKLQELV